MKENETLLNNVIFDFNDMRERERERERETTK
jgi:hypothetical protein